ncbi:hypothetical protein N2152v2_008717 [Parachlorella kessleri]
MEPNTANGAFSSCSTVVKVLVVVLGALLTVVVLALSHQHYTELRLDRVPLRRVSEFKGTQQQSAKQCTHYEELIQAVVAGQNPPQLSRQQLHWIATQIWSAGQGKGVPANFLVFGLGLDSITWRQINCLGRTVFLENWQSWIDKITGIDPLLEVYKVDYNTTVGTADAWFNGGRWPVALPANVTSSSWDVILVDAPQGYAGDMPGRMQSAQLALNLAQRCLEQGKLQRVVIFLHDMNRPLEQRIGREVFGADPNLYYLGLMRGPLGNLAAWEYSKDVREAIAPE